MGMTKVIDVAPPGMRTVPGLGGAARQFTRRILPSTGIANGCDKPSM